MSGTLVLVRHGQSDWNLKNLFTGWKDPELTELGVQEATAGGQALAETGIKFDIAFTSELKRARKPAASFWKRSVRAVWRRSAISPSTSVTMAIFLG